MNMGDGYSSLLRNLGSRLFLKPRDLLKGAEEYFIWAEQTPLQEEQLFAYKGRVTRADLNKVRPFTKTGLASFLGITVGKLDSFKKKGPDWVEAVSIIEQIIYMQKFDNAAAGLLNASIISRDLGLAERAEVSGPEGGAIKTESVVEAADSFASRMAALAARQAQEDS